MPGSEAGGGGELARALWRERCLKGRVADLAAALDSVQRQSDLRHAQSADLLADLKRANRSVGCALTSTLWHWDLVYYSQQTYCGVSSRQTGQWSVP